ncbi:MAG TPA: hypothetical protein VNT26_02700 [Candidatus Sulfotelmatobacter sp.]|nr:hypothetical protein [Candidatus Sulfotelmatobacter sp.]
MNAGAPGDISPLEWYQVFRSRIEHEDGLISQRLSWLVAAQSFLFTAYAITTNGLSSLGLKLSGGFLDQARLLFRLIPIVALCTALLIYIGILAALKGIRELRQAYRAQPVARMGPPIQTSTSTQWLGLVAPLLLPLLFVAVWSCLLIRGL